MQSFIISHSSCAEQYGDMSADTQTHSHTHSHTIKPPTARVKLVGHTSINYDYRTYRYNSDSFLQNRFITSDFRLLSQNLIWHSKRCCSIYAVKTRRLPDNFNESKLIFLVVLATLFMWLAFLPTYFTVSHDQQKVALLTMFLILNSTLLILCLYAPKIYAILYVEETRMHIVMQATDTSMFRFGPTSVAPQTSATTWASERT